MLPHVRPRSRMITHPLFAFCIAIQSGDRSHCRKCIKAMACRTAESEREGEKEGHVESRALARLRISPLVAIHTRAASLLPAISQPEFALAVDACGAHASR